RYVQPQWNVLPTLTLNLGIRYDSEKYYGFDPATAGPFEAFSLSNQWSPRFGFAWDFIGDGSSKLFGSAGRFYYAIPTDLNIRAFTGNSALQTYNYDPASTAQFEGSSCDHDGQTGCIPRQQLFQGGVAVSEPVDPGTKAGYQDEATLGVEMALSSSLSVALKGTYRSLGRIVEDRCDLNYAFSGFSCSLF